MQEMPDEPRPLLDAAPAIQLHAFAAMTAFVLGIVQFSAPKGTLPHRTIGGVWVALMVVVSLSSFWIHQLRLWGPWSPIHLLSIFTLVTLPLAATASRNFAHAPTPRCGRHQQAATWTRGQNRRAKLTPAARPRQAISSTLQFAEHHTRSTTRKPSMTNCTARAASNTPSSRDSTTLPVTPTEDAKARRDDGNDDAEQGRELERLVARPAGEQQGRGNGARSGHQGDGQREGGDIVQMFLDRLLGLLRLSLDADAEHHIRGDREQQQPAGDAKRRQRDRELVQEPAPDQRRAGQNGDGNEAGPKRDPRACCDRHALRHGEEGRRQADRVDHDQQRHQGRDEIFWRHGGVVVEGSACPNPLPRAGGSGLSTGPNRRNAQAPPRPAGHSPLLKVST
jgi:uncharacterized membrane protein